MSADRPSEEQRAKFDAQLVAHGWTPDERVNLLEQLRTGFTYEERLHLLGRVLDGDETTIARLRNLAQQEPPPRAPDHDVPKRVVPDEARALLDRLGTSGRSVKAHERWQSERTTAREELSTVATQQQEQRAERKDETRAIAVRDPELDRIARLGQWLAYSEQAQPDAKGVAATAALRLYYAQELGLPPLAAAELSVIRGRLVVSAQLLRALAAREGFRVSRLDSSDTSCTAVLHDVSTGEVIGEPVTFTLEDAKRAGLVKDGSGWQKYPARMLWARASSLVVKDYAPAVALGLVTEDEAAEISERPAAPAYEPPEVRDATEAEWTEAIPADEPPESKQEPDS